MKDIPYNRWRAYDPEDTVRFYALRLNEAGMIKIEPAEDHRSGHGLAVPERAEEGAEGMITRREFLRGGRGDGRAARLDVRTGRRGGAAGDDAT